MTTGFNNPLGTGHLAMAFVCPQEYITRFNPDEGLCQGTIFPAQVSAYPTYQLLLRTAAKEAQKE